VLLEVEVGDLLIPAEDLDEEDVPLLVRLDEGPQTGGLGLAAPSPGDARHHHEDGALVMGRVDPVAFGIDEGNGPELLAHQAPLPGGGGGPDRYGGTEEDRR
jgi:hypothetical protein